MTPGSEISVPWDGKTITMSVRRVERGKDWIVAVHGLQSNKNMFNALFSDSRFSKFSIMAPDLVGFGESEKPHWFSYDLMDQAKILSHLIKSVPAESRVAFIGHSLGAMVGTLLLELIPKRLGRFISMEGNLTEADCGESVAASQVAPPLQEKYYINLLNRIALQDNNTGSTRAEWMQSTPFHAFFASSKSIVAWSGSNRLLGMFESSAHKKLLLTGERSKFRSKPAGNSLTVTTIRDAGHFMLMEKPEETLRAIHSFLIEKSATAP